MICSEQKRNLRHDAAWNVPYVDHFQPFLRANLTAHINILTYDVVAIEQRIVLIVTVMIRKIDTAESSIILL